MAQVVIIGGHGKIALRLSKILVDRADVVSSVIRNPTQSDDVAATGASPVVADVEHLDTEAIGALLADHDAVVWSAGAGGGDPARTYAVDRDAAIRTIDAAAAAGVRRFVMVSYFGAGPEHGVPEDDSFFAYAEAKAAADSYLKRTSLDWTILGPSRLTDGPGSGCIDVGGSRAASTGHVSRDNVALVAAAALSDPATLGTVIEFSDGDVPIHDAI